MNETTRVYGYTLTTLALYLLQVLQCRLLQRCADIFHKRFVSSRRFCRDVAYMTIPRYERRCDKSTTQLILFLKTSQIKKYIINSKTQN